LNKGNDNSRFLHCGGRYAAFGRNDASWVVSGVQATATATADFSAAAADAPPSVEMTGLWVTGREEQTTTIAKQQQISPLRRQSAPPSVEMTIFGW